MAAAPAPERAAAISNALQFVKLPFTKLDELIAEVWQRPSNWFWANFESDNGSFYEKRAEVIEDNIRRNAKAQGLTDDRAILDLLQACLSFGGDEERAVQLMCNAKQLQTAVDNFVDGVPENLRHSRPPPVRLKVELRSFPWLGIPGRHRINPLKVSTDSDTNTVMMWSARNIQELMFFKGECRLLTQEHHKLINALLEQLPPCGPDKPFVDNFIRRVALVIDHDFYWRQMIPIDQFKKIRNYFGDQTRKYEKEYEKRIKENKLNIPELDIVHENLPKEDARRCGISLKWFDWCLKLNELSDPRPKDNVIIVPTNYIRAYWFWIAAPKAFSKDAPAAGAGTREAGAVADEVETAAAVDHSIPRDLATTPRSILIDVIRTGIPILKFCHIEALLNLYETKKRNKIFTKGNDPVIHEVGRRYSEQMRRITGEPFEFAQLMEIPVPLAICRLRLLFLSDLGVELSDYALTLDDYFKERKMVGAADVGSTLSAAPAPAAAAAAAAAATDTTGTEIHTFAAFKLLL